IAGQFLDIISYLIDVGLHTPCRIKEEDSFFEIVPFARSFIVEMDGTKKYSPPLEVTKNGLGSPGGNAAVVGRTRAKPSTLITFRGSSAATTFKRTWSPSWYFSSLSSFTVRSSPDEPFAGGPPMIGSWPEKRRE
ncbi:unnamed protein product, partial [Rhizoctonia solani]